MVPVRTEEEATRALTRARLLGRANACVADVSGAQQYSFFAATPSFLLAYVVVSLCTVDGKLKLNLAR